MNILKTKNIFSNLEFNKKTIFISNIENFFGNRIIDTLIHYPKDIINKNLQEIFDKKDENKLITLDLKVIEHKKNYNKRIPYTIICKTKKNQLVNILFFNFYQRFFQNTLLLNKVYRVTGKLMFFSNSFQFVHPPSIVDEFKFSQFEEIEPEYDLSRKKINKKLFRNLVKDNLEIFKKYEFPDEWILKKFKKKEWLSYKESIINLHTPSKGSTIKNCEHIRKRLAFDELLSNFLIFNNLKKSVVKKNYKQITSHTESNEIIKKLEFKLTKDQRKSLKEIKDDINSNKRMYRLLQGDVGTGKTIVALLVISDFVNAGFQAVLMAPTELLANQHYQYFKELLPKKIKIELLTGNVKNKDKIYEKVKKKKTDLLIGTHAVYNSSIKFKNLGIIIIDEQHKFGVNQRINLLEKSINSHTLIMSATPIPRSLSFAIYGEISISNIRSKPEGREKVITSIISKKQTNELIEGIKRKINRSEQVFWILPLIGDEIQENEKETVLSRFEYLNKIFTNQVTIAHSKMSKDNLEKNMNEFQKKKRMILISTTVIEVGINIPSASLMIIENADRFGLAQLHQLRGRISRSNKESHCVLMHNHNLSNISKQRLLILKNNSDGFEIAEKDLLLRGAGDFLGTNQSGLPKWRFFKPLEDYRLVDDVKKNCEFLVKESKKNKKKINFLINSFFREINFTNFFSP